MPNKATFNFADNTFTDHRDKRVYQAYIAGLRSNLSNAAIAVAMHRSEPAVKSVAFVSCKKSGTETILTKYHCGGTLTIHAYNPPKDQIDQGYSWTSEITIKDGEVTVH